MKQFILLILAAGKGTRLKSDLPKVLHPLAGKPLIEYVLDASRPLGPSSILIVVGHEAEAVKSALAGLPAQFIDQVPQLGTGHAVQLAKPHWESHRGTDFNTDSQKHSRDPLENQSKRHVTFHFPGGSDWIWSSGQGLRG